MRFPDFPDCNIPDHSLPSLPHSFPANSRCPQRRRGACSPKFLCSLSRKQTLKNRSILQIFSEYACAQKSRNTNCIPGRIPRTIPAVAAALKNAYSNLCSIFILNLRSRCLPAVLSGKSLPRRKKHTFLYFAAVMSPIACRRLLSGSVVSCVSSHIITPPRFSLAYAVLSAIISTPL